MLHPFKFCCRAGSGGVGGLFFFVTVTLMDFTYARDGAIAIAMAGPATVRHTNRVMRMSVDSISSGLRLTSATRVIILSTSNRRIPCRVACSRGMVFPTAMGTGKATTCAVRTNAPTMFSAGTYKHRCPRHMSSIT